MRRLLFTVLGFLSSHLSAGEPAAPLAWPEIKRETKPWTRWWWFGNIADEKSLTSEMEKYAAAGLGGLEITPIYGVRGYEDRFVSFLSPRWVELLDHTLAEARRLGLGIDLATGTGWPFGGPWLPESDTAHTLAHKTYSLAAGEKLAGPVALRAEPFLRFAGATRVPLDEIRQPLSANSNLQALAIDQVRFPNPLNLVALVAFPVGSSTADRPLPAPVDLTARVDSAGQLDWTAPADGAPWTLYALFSGLHGKLVERAAPGAEAYALDHLSSSALKNYLRRFDEAFAGRDTSGLRAFFNDSYEVDDAHGEADWTPDFFAEFQQRRGYDLRRHLPELFGTSATSPVLSDYRETISDLLLDEFTRPWRAWANARGAKIRNQAHGSPANILDLYAASDIPEQEGNGPLAMKLAASAAHLTGQPLASAESATWLNEHWLTTLAELKENADTFLLSGINHLCYHGTPFSPPDDPWPGFNFYASVELSPVNPLWTDFPALNAYLTRAQAFLQHGRPDEGLLLYYNIHDRWAERGDGRMPHFGHGNRDPVGVSAGALAAELHAQGYGFDYISDRLLQDASSRDDRIEAGPQSYHAILLPAVTHLPTRTLEKLLQLAGRGATILVHRHLPQKPAGLSSDAAAFARALAEIQHDTSTANGITTARVGRGRFLIGENLPSLLAARAGLARETMVDLGLAFVRRTSDAGPFYFVVNRGHRRIDGWIPFAAATGHAAIFDPMTGAAGLAATREREVYLQLEPGASCIVQFRRSADGPRWSYWEPAAEPQSLRGEWSIAFTEGGPSLPPAIQTSDLKSWTELGGDEAKVFSGTAAYNLEFPRPAGSADAWQLDLGTVCDSARVTLNGRELAVLFQPPWRLTLPADLLRDRNTLQVRVTNLAANRIADLDRRGVPWKKFYNINMPPRLPQNAGPDRLFTAAHWPPRDSGLLGPVTVTPLRAFHP